MVDATSDVDDFVVDLFAHSETTLMTYEISDRRCYTIDTEPVFSKITIGRLDRFRETGKLGWQIGNPSEKELEFSGDVMVAIAKETDVTPKVDIRNKLSS